MPASSDPASPNSDQKLPTVSIVVATHNRQRSLEGFVETLQALDYPRHLIELVIVDDGSNPPARTLTSNVEIRLVRQNQSGPARARNAGIQAASGEFIAITDDDCRPHPAWVRVLCTSYLAKPDALIGGLTQNALHDNPYASASQALIDYLYNSLLQTSPGNSFFTTSNLGGARSCFLRIGGFDESFPLPAAEDRDLCDRWKAFGPLLYAPDAVVEHHHQMGFSGFLRQHFRYGRGARVLHSKRTARNLSPNIEGVAFYWKLMVFPFYTKPLAKAVPLILLFVASQISGVVGYIYEGALQRDD